MCKKNEISESTSNTFLSLKSRIATFHTRAVNMVTLFQIQTVSANFSAIQSVCKVFTSLNKKNIFEIYVLKSSCSKRQTDISTAWSHDIWITFIAVVSFPAQMTTFITQTMDMATS